MIANGISTGCDVSGTGHADIVQMISLATGAVFLLGDVFPAEEREFKAMGGIPNGIATAVVT